MLGSLLAEVGERGWTLTVQLWWRPDGGFRSSEDSGVKK